MKPLRVAILALLFLTGGAVVSYAVAWWAMYRFDDLAPRGVQGMAEDLPTPTKWPMPMPDDWPTIETLGDGLFSKPSARRWSANGIEIRNYCAGHNSIMYGIEEVQAGWPARTASRFDHREDPAWSTMRHERAETGAWFGGLYIVGRPLLDSTGAPTRFRWPVYLPLRPVWPGLLCNSAFYGTILFALNLPIRRYVHRRRTRAGLCRHCKYPVGVSPVCTECGSPILQTPRTSKSNP